MHTLVLGGTRSGKSAYAEGLLAGTSRVRYLATAADRADDTEWQARLRAHRHRRPDSWRTLECGEAPESVPQLLREAADGDAYLVDDLGGWVTAICDAAGWHPGAIDRPLTELSDALHTTRGTVVLVSPEVGLSVVPDNRAARLFADALGTVNRTVAGVCSGVVLVVAGQPLWIKRAEGSNLSP
ncbi:MAG: bifunctional adenosylcobinamide kinase/adenosylcobinamide-phosphate guanylyltransferase [Micromonosporaceae bacterium]